MKRLCLRWLIVLLFLAPDAMAAPPQWAYRIAFTDKAGAPALSNPNVFLSTRALQRRTQQGIAVSEEDRPVSPAYTDSVLRLSGGKMHCTSRWFNQCVILVTDTTNIAAIRTRPFVTGVSLVGYFLNGLHKGAPAGGKEPVLTTPSTARKGTGSSSYYNFTWSQTSMVNGDFLHDNGLTGSGQLIAVLDLGFDGVDSHPGFDSLRAQGRIVDAYNFVGATTDVYHSGFAHGTACLSTIAGFVPGTYVGSAPHAQYALYLTDDNHITDALYELDNFVAGLERADSLGADIVTSSLGYNTFVNPAVGTDDYTRAELDGHTTMVARAMNKAVAKGMFAINSAGNEGGNNWNFLLTPSDADSALTVGAVFPNRSIAGYSSPGPNSSGRVKPDVVLQGEPAAVFSTTGYYNSGGTSFSTPQVAGWAACIRQSKPAITPAALRQAIILSADRAANPDAQGGYGYGIPDFKKVLGYVGVQALPGNRGFITVSPNPFRDQLLLHINTGQALALEAVLYDMSGRIIAREQFRVLPGKQAYTFPLSPQLPAGSYLLQAACNGAVTSFKLTRS